jgi:hypothetical protein
MKKQLTAFEEKGYNFTIIYRKGEWNETKASDAAAGSNPLLLYATITSFRNP